MSDVIFELPETRLYCGLLVSSPTPEAWVDVNLSEDGERAAGRLLSAEQAAELRDALILHTLGADLAAKVQAVIAGDHDLGEMSNRDDKTIEALRSEIAQIQAENAAHCVERAKLDQSVRDALGARITEMTITAARRVVADRDRAEAAEGETLRGECIDLRKTREDAVHRALAAEANLAAMTRQAEQLDSLTRDVGELKAQDRSAWREVDDTVTQSLNRIIALERRQAAIADELAATKERMQHWRENITTVGPVADELTMLHERIGLSIKALDRMDRKLRGGGE